MEYAIIRSGGKQYKVLKDSVLLLEHLDIKPGESFSLEDVLLYVSDDGKMNLGKPKSEGISVKATVLEHIRGEKLRIAKFKAKAKYRRVTGHRQSLTRVKINEIVSGKKEAKIKKTKETSQES